MLATVYVCRAGRPLCTVNQQKGALSQPAVYRGQMMKPKTRLVLEMAIKEGISFGWNRAHKHTETPDEDVVKQQIEQHIWNSIYEWFDMGEENEH